MCVVEVIAVVLTLLGAAYWVAGIFLPSEYDVEDTTKEKACADKQNRSELRLTKRP